MYHNDGWRRLFYKFCCTISNVTVTVYILVCPHSNYLGNLSLNNNSLYVCVILPQKSYIPVTFSSFQFWMYYGWQRTVTAQSLCGSFVPSPARLAFICPFISGEILPFCPAGTNRSFAVYPGSIVNFRSDGRHWVYAHPFACTASNCDLLFGIKSPG